VGIGLDLVRGPRTRIRFIGLSHIQNGKSYEQVAQYLLQSLSAVKQWVRHERRLYFDNEY
jgi:transposase